MINPADTRRHQPVMWGVACACCLLSAGCSDPSTTAGIAHPSVASATASPPAEVIAPTDDANAVVADPREEASTADNAVVKTTDETPATATPAQKPAPETETAHPPRERTFAVDGPEGALRVGFDDLDLLKILKMDPVTPDCVEKMPGWLQKLDGKKIRIRGFMKPGLLLTGIPQFTFVRDTGLCCFGPKGKIYDLIAVTLKGGTTTDYIELRPFDVVGTFKIDLLQLDDDGTIHGLYWINDAVIVQK
jgi:hypothetical protein